jgi:hypothetical protein
MQETHALHQRSGAFFLKIGQSDPKQAFYQDCSKCKYKKQMGMSWVVSYFIRIGRGAAATNPEKKYTKLKETRMVQSINGSRPSKSSQAFFSADGHSLLVKAFSYQGSGYIQTSMDRSVSSKNDRPFSPKGSTADGIDHKLDKIELQLSQLRSKQFENLELEMEWKRREVIDAFFILIDDHCSVHQLSKHAQYTHARPYFNCIHRRKSLGVRLKKCLVRQANLVPKKSAKRRAKKA